MEAQQPTALGALIWSMVYAGLAAFFVVSSRLFPRRGFELLGVMLGLLSVSGLGIWMVLGRTDSPELASLGVLLVLTTAAFGPVLNTHFLLYFSGQPSSRRWLPLGYVLAGLAVLAQLMVIAKTRLAGERPADLIWVSPLVASVLLTLLVVHLAAAGALLTMAVRAGRKRARLPLVVLILLGPIAAVDFFSFSLSSSSSLLTETVVWVYALSILWGLLSELRGAEGLLQETTTSLAARTAELQVSYAELEIVQTELSKKEQLAAVGELAASIAHEVRNPLAIIMNAASGLRRSNLSTDDRETLLSIVDEESLRLNQLVTELLRFARPVQAARAPASLADICEKVRSSAPEGYEVKIIRLGTESTAVWVDPGLFRLAIDNLMANAMQAMPDGGVIELSIGRTTFDDGQAAEALCVADSGQGMTAAEVEKAKKPFFTTKPRGTGLGLPIAERILDAHGGQLLIESEKGKGTRVSLLVPSDQDGDARASSSQVPSTRRRRHSSKGSLLPKSTPSSSPLSGRGVGVADPKQEKD